MPAEPSLPLSASRVKPPLTAAADWLDARINVKHSWRRLQLFARCLIVSTFIDDTLRIACDHEGQRASMEQAHESLSHAATHLLPVLFVLTQASGSLLVLCGRPGSEQLGVCILATWAAIHPFLYKQQENTEFMVESLSIIGGLLILLASMRATARRGRAEPHAAGSRVDLLQRAGRSCHSALFVYYAAKAARERLAALEGRAAAEAPGVALIEGVLLAALACLSALLILGLRSRLAALALAVATAGAALFKHPWYVTMWSDGTFALDDVVGYEGMRVSAWLYSNHQRYFFFQQLSTAGALLQLVVYGPGRLSVDEADGPLEVVALTSKGGDD